MYSSSLARSLICASTMLSSIEQFGFSVERDPGLISRGPIVETVWCLFNSILCFRVLWSVWKYLFQLKEIFLDDVFLRFLVEARHCCGTFWGEAIGELFGLFGAAEFPFGSISVFGSVAVDDVGDEFLLLEVVGVNLSDGESALPFFFWGRESGRGGADRMICV